MFGYSWSSTAPVHQTPRGYIARIAVMRTFASAYAARLYIYASEYDIAFYRHTRNLYAGMSDVSLAKELFAEARRDLPVGAARAFFNEGDPPELASLSIITRGLKISS